MKRPHHSLAQLAQARQAAITQADDALIKGASAEAAKPMTTFAPPVLEHLRQSNMAAYEAMLATMQADIANVLKRS